MVHHKIKFTEDIVAVSGSLRILSEQFTPKLMRKNSAEYCRLETKYVSMVSEIKLFLQKTNNNYNTLNMVENLSD